ncbi:hypothetical protein [Pseudomonas viridiflava]|uniref:hypothetical protein n=1 Tax=Pseudomonas viridiflava TaxID=33069 RepID=UPI000F03F77B|nr:hypothetical protein [Pseudomonas viridiflava]
MHEDLRDVYSRDVVSFPLVIKGYEVRKGVKVGGFDVSLDVQKVVRNHIQRFFVVVKSTEVAPKLEAEYLAEVNSLRKGLGIHVYLAVVNDVAKKIALSKELAEKMDFPDEEYALEFFVLPPMPKLPGLGR